MPRKTLEDPSNDGLPTARRSKNKVGKLRNVVDVRRDVCLGGKPLEV